MPVRVADDDWAGIAQPYVEKRRRNNLRHISGQCMGGFLGKSVGTDKLHLLSASVCMNRARERGNLGLRTLKIVKPKIHRAWKANPDAVMLRPFRGLDAIHQSALALQRQQVQVCDLLL